MDTNPTPDPNPVAERPLRIKIFGVGGGGTNTVDRLVLSGFLGDDPGARHLSACAVNTDAQALAASVVPEKINIGSNLTRGYGAGGNPETGERAALEDRAALEKALEGADVVFLATCLGGGTGTGASPVLAQLARERNILTLAFVTLPFQFELERRRQIAHAGLAALKQHADAVICVPNDKLFHLVGEKTSFLDAFRQADDLLGQGVRGIWRLLSRTGLINLDFADIRAVLQGRHGESAFGYAEASGENRDREAIRLLLESPLMKDSSALTEADSLLVSIVGGPDLTLAEVHRAMEQITKLVSADAHLILGAAIEEEFAGRLALMLIAAGRSEPSSAPPAPPDKTEGELVSVAPGPACSARSKSVDRWRKRQNARINPRELEQVQTAVGHELKPQPQPKAPKQGTLDLGVPTRGRFEQAEPTIIDGENLDLPTYLRKGIKIV